LLFVLGGVTGAIFFRRSLFFLFGFFFRDSAFRGSLADVVIEDFWLCGGGFWGRRVELIFRDEGGLGGISGYGAL
jgi:hypothetical protein